MVKSQWQKLTKLLKIVDISRVFRAPKVQKIYMPYFFVVINDTMEQLFHPLPIKDLQVYFFSILSAHLKVHKAHTMIPLNRKSEMFFTFKTTIILVMKYHFFKQGYIKN